MGWITLVQVAISISEGLLSSLTKSKAPQEILSALSNALTELNKVHTSLVTKAQVDGITLDYKW